MDAIRNAIATASLVDLAHSRVGPVRLQANVFDSHRTLATLASAGLVILATVAIW
jgi:hypothetical protein